MVILMSERNLISKLPLLSKILENIVYKWLTAHMSRHDIFPKFPSGFQEKHSTETALLRVTKDLLLAADAAEGSAWSLT